jgi:hypothetical protein
VVSWKLELNISYIFWYRRIVGNYYWVFAVMAESGHKLCRDVLQVQLRIMFKLLCIITKYERANSRHSIWKKVTQPESTSALMCPSIECMSA